MADGRRHLGHVHRPGTKYDAPQSKAPWPDCGHRYKVPSTGQKGGKSSCQ
ncbi:hypothetical protein ACH492_10805 [Streptomyces sp. NPDC019443]